MVIPPGKNNPADFSPQAATHPETVIMTAERTTRLEPVESGLLTAAVWNEPKPQPWED
jgi:hypothetical protein